MLYKRGEVWWIKLKWDGNIIRQSTEEKDENKARLAERQILKELAKGNRTGHDPADHVLFSEVWEKYMAEEAPLKAQTTYERAKQCAKNFLPVLGNLRLSKISPSVLSSYRNKRLKDGVGINTVVKELQYVRRVLSLCKKDWQLIGQNPFELFNMPTVNDQRVRYLAPGEYEKLVAACPKWLQPVVVVARLTGIRRSNLADMTWGQINLETKLITLNRTKNGFPLTIPLCETAYTALVTLHNDKSQNKDCPNVFQKDGKPLTPGQITAGFRRVCKRIGMTDFRYHDLRHDFASNLVQNGQQLYHVQSLLGHRDGRMTQRYAHLRVDDLRKAVAVLG
ncbi:MAG: tyrosine-type recombinase/integrase [Nitrospiraceae bacterium]|nr:tyrosine-type recombinase/integrase [Nitrospiraceae bacterium]